MRTRDEIDIDAEDLTTAEAARFAGVEQGVIRQWVWRRYLPVASRDDRGRPRFRALDVAKAEARTRRRARR